MVRVVTTVCLCVFLGTIFSNGDLTSLDDIRRALDTLGFGEDNDKERRHLSCKAYNEDCDLLRHCCGDLQCFWPNGYKPFSNGHCTGCFNATDPCQRDSQCCQYQGLQCNKDHLMKANGSCQKRRTYGECYRNKQCVHACRRKWYKPKGVCW